MLNLISPGENQVREVVKLQFNTLIRLIDLYPNYTLLICGGLLLVTLFLLLVLFIKVTTLSRKYSKLTSAEINDKAIGISGENIDLENLSRKLDMMENKVSSTLRNVAMVRFDAFERMGNGLSFALAVLDDNGDGFVISSLYGEVHTRTYAKQIIDGKPSHPLSPEEKEAISRAMESR